MCVYIRHRASSTFGVFGSTLNPQSSMVSSILNPFLHPSDSRWPLGSGIWDWCLGGCLESGVWNLGSGIWDWCLGLGSGIVSKGPRPPFPVALADTKKHLQKQTPTFDPILPSQDPKVHPSCHLASFFDPK